MVFRVSSAISLDGYLIRWCSQCAWSLRLEEREQIGIDLVLESRAHPVGRARIDLQRRALDELRGEHGRGADRHDLVVVAMQDQSRYIKSLEVFREVCLGERLDAVNDAVEAGQHPLEPEGVSQPLRDLGTGPVGAVEGCAEVLEERFFRFKVRGLGFLTVLS